MSHKANREFIQHKLNFVTKCFDSISAVKYDGMGNVRIDGKGLRKEPYIGFLGNAQLAGNLARAVAEDYNIEFEKVEQIK